jgi:hypothetical protein
VAANGFDPFTGSTRPSPYRVAAHFTRLLRTGGAGVAT